MICNPSRNHCTAAPVMKTLPSRAYSVLLPMRHAIVVNRLFLETNALSPVCINIKHPVPYVFFTIPGLIHICPNNAACWSPAMPAMGIAEPGTRLPVTPYTSLLDLTSGNIFAGMLKRESSSSSHRPVWILNSIVLDALDASVT